MTEREITIRHRIDFFWILLSAIFCGAVLHNAVRNITIRSVYVDQCLSVEDCRERVLEVDAKVAERKAEKAKED